MAPGAADESGPGPSDRPSDGSLDTTEERGLVTRTVPLLAAGMDPEPGTRVGEYVIERKVGRGGMGTVFAAVHPVIGKRAAIKVMAWDLSRDASFVARFVREARAVNRIRHPNIVEAFSIGQLEDGRCCYAMEWLDGISLYDRLREGPMALAEVVDILDQIADALEAVHEAGIVHRDLSPRNLYLVDVRGRRTVKILDFGIAKEVGLDSGAVSTHSGVLLGTPSYLSPEQAAGEPVDARADIYGLGVVGYQMLTGRPPFAGDSTTGVLTRKRVETPATVASLRPDVPAVLASAVDAMLAIDPRARPSLPAIRGALAARRMAPPARAAAAPARRRLVGRRGAALLAGAVVGTVGYLAVRQLVSSPDREPAAASTAAVPAAAPVAAPVARADAAPPAVPEARGAIVINVDADDARIELDGALVGAAVRQVQVAVDAAGAHRLVVTAPGRTRYESEVAVAAGVIASVDVVLLPADPEPPGQGEGQDKPEPERERDDRRTRRRPADQPAPPKSPPTSPPRPPPAKEDPDYLLQPSKLPD